MQRARLALYRHPEQGFVSSYCFYNATLRFRDLAFDIGANHGAFTELMLKRGVRVVAVEPQAQLAAELSQRFPAATVLPVAVAEEPGEAQLHRAREGDNLASLDPRWNEIEVTTVTWQDTVTVPVTTLDAMIEKYGKPTLIKIDTEGFDHRVVKGLSQPIDHILFEVQAAVPHVPEQAFGHLRALGRYEYSVDSNDWHFRKGTSEEILANLPPLGNVYARRVA